jgi:hypothetical protein
MFKPEENSSKFVLLYKITQGKSLPTPKALFLEKPQIFLS